MPAGLLQLVSYGVESMYLSADPQITLFKIIYRRHTNFALESLIQTFSTRPDFGQSVCCTLTKTGDLVGKIILYIELPEIPKINSTETSSTPLVAWVKNIGYYIIKETSIEIGGNIIDKHYGEWLYIWSQMSNTKTDALNRMIGNIPEMYTFTNGKPMYKLYVPLNFWFCKSNGLALPIVSLISSSVKISVQFRRWQECLKIGPTNSIKIKEDISPFKNFEYIQQNDSINGLYFSHDYILGKIFYNKLSNKPFEPNDKINSMQNPEINVTPIEAEEIESTNIPYVPQIVNSWLYVDNIYLDKDERSKFISHNHEYLIEQLQFNQVLNVTSPGIKQNLMLEHPCKAIYWVAQLSNSHDPFNYTVDLNPTINSAPVSNSAKLTLNGTDRFSTLSYIFFNWVYPNIYFNTSPETGINLWSASLYPGELQPSGALNMSKIDNINIFHILDKKITPDTPANIRTYAVNYNILRFGFGMASLAFD